MKLVRKDFGIGQEGSQREALARNAFPLQMEMGTKPFAGVSHGSRPVVIEELPWPGAILVGDFGRDGEIHFRIGDSTSEEPFILHVAEVIVHDFGEFLEVEVWVSPLNDQFGRGFIPGVQLVFQIVGRVATPAYETATRPA
jgi:hypothetical protein